MTLAFVDTHISFATFAWMAEACTFVTTALKQFAISVFHPLAMLTSPAWTFFAWPAMKSFSRGKCVYLTMSVSVWWSLSTSLTSLHLLGILCVSAIRTGWKTVSPGSFSCEAWTWSSHWSSRAISNDLSIPSQCRWLSGIAFHAWIYGQHSLGKGNNFPAWNTVGKLYKYIKISKI